VIEKEEEKN